MRKFKSNNKVLSVILLFIFLFSVLLYAYSTGITGRTKKNGVGCTCHSPFPTTSVHVVITGPDTLNVGQKAMYTLTITGGPLVRAGTDIAVSNGKLSPISSSEDLRLDNSDGELTHKLPKAPSNNEVQFQFYYTAPSTAGDITIYGVGNSVNFDGINDSQDKWNFSPNKVVLITQISAVNNENKIPGNFELFQNYPNPFNPTTTISYIIPESGLVNLTIYNSIGQLVKTVVNKYQSAGLHSITINGDNLTSGIYFYKLISGSSFKMKKFVLLK